MLLNIENIKKDKNIVVWELTDEMKEFNTEVTDRTIVADLNLITSILSLTKNEDIYAVLKNISMKSWKNSFFVMKAIKILASIKKVNIVNFEVWSNPVVIHNVKYNKSFFNKIWIDGIESIFYDALFVKNIIAVQKDIYENFNEEKANIMRVFLKNFYNNQLFNDLDWVLEQLEVNPFIYKYLDIDMKVNDEVLALTFSTLNKIETPKTYMAEIIPYMELIKDPYVMSAFLTFFYNEIKNYDLYYSHALKVLKTESLTLAVLEYLDDENVFKAVFAHKDFPIEFKEDTSILLQALKRCKKIFETLPDYLKDSKAVVEIMINEHKSAYLNAKSVDYWRQDINTPKLNTFVHKYLNENVADLSILKFVHWRRNFDFLIQLETNPFEFSVKFSKDDFEAITQGDFTKGKELTLKFPNFYELASVDIKRDLDCILKYVQYGLGDFETRFEYLHPNLFSNNELIFSFIKEDIGEVLYNIPEYKWNERDFILEYVTLLDDVINENNKEAFDCLYEFVPEQIRDFFKTNGIKENYFRFLRDYLKKTELE